MANSVGASQIADATEKVAAAVQSAGSEDAKSVCEPCCKNRIKEIEAETKAITKIDDPIERNKAITQAYKTVAENDPQNRWVKLASIVSAQGGCAMQKVSGVRSYLPSWKEQLDKATGASMSHNMYQALGDANKAIFRDIYPVAAYKAKYGWQNLKECYSKENKPLPPELEDAFDKMDQGEVDQAADGIAKFEQMKVVQPVYDQYSGTFTAMKVASAVRKPFMGNNLYDIPVSTKCGDPETVPFAGDIAKGKDRVGYYRALMDKLITQQGW